MILYADLHIFRLFGGERQNGFISISMRYIQRFLDMSLCINMILHTEYMSKYIQKQATFYIFFYAYNRKKNKRLETP